MLLPVAAPVVLLLLWLTSHDNSWIWIVLWRIGSSSVQAEVALFSSSPEKALVSLAVTSLEGKRRTLGAMDWNEGSVGGGVIDSDGIQFDYEQPVIEKREPKVSMDVC